MSELDSIKKDLKIAWGEYLKDDSAAVGTAILAMNRLINHLIQTSDDTADKVIE